MSSIEKEIVFSSEMVVEAIRVSASDEDVVRAARVSTVGEDSKVIADLLAMNDEDRENEERRSKGLINYLMRDRHGSPFEHNSFNFYIQAPIFVFREFMRHRIASYNEESGRYKELSPKFYIPAKNRNLVQVGKAGAYDFVPGSAKQHRAVDRMVRLATRTSYFAYKVMLKFGVAREVARIILPLNIYSSMYVTMNARSLMNFLSLRTKSEDSHFPSFPQREIEMVAEQMEEIFKEAMPETYAAFVKNGRVAP